MSVMAGGVGWLNDGQLAPRRCPRPSVSWCPGRIALSIRYLSVLRAKHFTERPFATLGEQYRCVG